MGVPPNATFDAESNTFTAPDGRKYSADGKLLDVATGKPREELDAKRLSKTAGLKALGNQGTTYATDSTEPKPELLETFPNPMKPPETMRPDSRFATGISLVPSESEFTSLCPLTGQPDFASIIVEYTPRDVCVESKSWKLYLGSYRQVREFHESCVTRIFHDLFNLLDPLYLKVTGGFTARGAIAFRPVMEYTAPDA